MTLLRLARKGKELYANKHMRRQWLEKTIWLASTGKHRLINQIERAHG